LVTTMRPVL